MLHLQCQLKSQKEGSYSAPTGVAQWIEYWPTNQSVAGLSPSQGTCLGCGPELWARSPVGGT